LTFFGLMLVLLSVTGDLRKNNMIEMATVKKMMLLYGT